MKRIGIDMDEVIADTLGELLARYNRDFGTSYGKQELMGQKRFWEIVPVETRPRIFEYFEDGEIFADLPVFDEAVSVVRDLQSRYEVFIATAAMEVPMSFNAKFRWLKRHFPFIPASHIVFCGDKSVVAVDYLIDDNVRHFERMQGEGIVFTAPHNVHETKWRRVGDWAEVREMFLAPA
jgi:5'(3')-deoxyribonucleotidase